jgi:Uncharacterised nucleotidyltransferase
MQRTGSRLEPEWTFLRTACFEAHPEKKPATIRALLDSTIRWKLLFDLADRHGVIPLLAHTLLSLRDSVPPGQISFLQAAHQTNLHKTMLLARELIRIMHQLTGLGIEVMPYKGLSLAETIYGDIALRQAGDIDLLIRAVDLKRVCAVLGELGYSPQLRFSEAEERAYLKSGYECAFDGAAGPNLIEVQWAIQPRFYAVDLSVDGLFERATITTIAGYSVKTPSLEDLFIVLAVHAAKHAWARLIWLCDLARIMHRPEVNWRQIASRGKELGILRILRITLLLANHPAVPIPGMAEEVIPADPAAARVAEEIQGYLSNQTSFDVESLAYFRLMLRLRERRADRIRFLSRLVSTPGPGEWAVARLPGPLFPLYRLVRLGRLIAKLARAESPTPR